MTEADFSSDINRLSDMAGQLPEGFADVEVDVVRGLSRAPVQEATDEIIVASSTRRPRDINGETPAVPAAGRYGYDRTPDEPTVASDSGGGSDKPPDQSEPGATDEPEEPFGVHGFDSEHVRRRELVQAGAIQIASAEDARVRHGRYIDTIGPTTELSLERHSERGVVGVTIVGDDTFDVTFRDAAGAESRHLYLTDKHTGLVVRQDRIPETVGLEAPRLGELPTREIWDLQRRRESPQTRYYPEDGTDLDRHVVGPAQMKYIADLTRWAHPRIVSLGDLHDLAVNRGMTTHLPEAPDAMEGAREFAQYVTDFLADQGYDVERAVSDSTEVRSGASSMHVVTSLDRSADGAAAPSVHVSMSGIYDPGMVRNLPPQQRAQYEDTEGAVRINLRYGIAAGQLVAKRTMNIVHPDGESRQVPLYQDTRRQRLVPGDVAEARMVRNFLRRPFI